MRQVRHVRIALVSLLLILGACASTDEIGPSQAERARATGQDEVFAGSSSAGDGGRASPAEADAVDEGNEAGSQSSARAVPEDPNVVSSDTVEAREGRDLEVVAAAGYDDPLIEWNRRVFAFNDAAYRYALIPLAKGYLNVVPGPVQGRVGDFFHNIKSPIYIVNYLAQGEGGEAGNSLLRFAVNSTLGLAGLFDVADHWLGIERRDTRSASTLQQYGVDEGPYLVLPLIGPATVRNGGALVLDAWLNPLAYILDSPESWVVRGVDNLQDYAPNADPYLNLREESEDLYTFVRNLYLEGLERDENFRREGLPGAGPGQDASAGANP